MLVHFRDAFDSLKLSCIKVFGGVEILEVDAEEGRHLVSRRWPSGAVGQHVTSMVYQAITAAEFHASRVVPGTEAMPVLKGIAQGYSFPRGKGQQRVLPIEEPIARRTGELVFQLDDGVFFKADRARVWDQDIPGNISETEELMFLAIFVSRNLSDDDSLPARHLASDPQPISV